MPFRKVVFWIHLACGLTAGLVILTMSFTGILLTYEKQLVEWSDREYWGTARDQHTPVPLDQIVANAKAHDSQARVAALVVYSDPSAPVGASLGGGRTVYLDPVSGLVQGEGTLGMREFFATVKSWHRWLGVEGDARNRARSVTGWSNVVFLFMVLSGLYLWVPKRLSWQHLRPVLLYNRKAVGKARDFNWHHVFGFWLSLPLAVIVASATFISFPWVSDWALDRVADVASVSADESPRSSAPDLRAANDSGPPALDQLLEIAQARVPAWRTISINLLTPTDAPIEFRIAEGWEGDPRGQSTLTLSRADAGEVSYETHAAQPPGRRMRLFFRFAHTGEYYGVLGQTLAGLASLAGVILVWSGFALAWRRLGSPILKRRRSVSKGL